MLPRGLQDPLEDPGLGDGVIGRQHDHDLVGRPVDGDGRERDRGCRVAADGLAQDRHVRNLFVDEVRVPGVGHDVHGPLDEPLDALDGLLDQRPLAEQRQERLRAVVVAQGPQPRSTAAGEDHRVHRANSRAAPSAPDDDPSRGATASERRLALDRRRRVR